MEWGLDIFEFSTVVYEGDPHFEKFSAEPCQGFKP